MKAAGSASASVAYVRSKITGLIFKNPMYASALSPLPVTLPYAANLSDASRNLAPQIYSVAASDTQGIRATSVLTVDAIGFYLLEVEANFSTEYKDTEGRKGSVVAVVSKQYNANDFITGYADSAIAYEHTGAAQTLSSLRVKVIDPLTKLPVKGLGKNSTVFMEVVQPSPQQKP